MFSKSLNLLLALCLAVLPVVWGLEIGTDFRTPKNVVFGAMFGGASHVNWVLNILNELSDRGHNVTFVTRDDLVRFGKPYPAITVLSAGGPMFNADRLKSAGARQRKASFRAMMLGKMKTVYADEYNYYTALFNATQTDVAVCDHFCLTCVDAAKAFNIPFIITTAIALTPDASAPYINNDIDALDTPTTLDMTLSTRIYNKFVVPALSFYKSYKPMQEFLEVQRSVGAPPLSSNPWKDALKIVQSSFGFEAARPLGPLVELIGPIVNPHYSPLTPELSEYLDQHHKVVYVAFGHAATPTTEDITLLLTALISNMEKGTIDGFVWATVHARANFPKTIKTLSNKEYDLSDILNNHDPHCRLIDWAPQQAILLHPSTSVFITHGGLGSLHEGLLARKRLAVFPYFGDQPSNARMVEINQIGAHIDYRISHKAAAELLERVVNDENGVIQENVDRFHALVQIASKNAPTKGANLVEEVLFMHKNGKLPHRYEAARQMSYIKAHNIDIYAVIATTAAVVIKGAMLLFTRFTQDLPAEEKLKSH